jgi:hypothetical protein
LKRIAALCVLLAPAQAWAQEDEHPDEPPRPTSPPDVPEVSAPPPVSNETLPTEVPPDDGDDTAAAPAEKTPATPPSSGRLGRRAIPDSSWRRRAREGEPSSGAKYFDPLHFVIELRFGPYFPEVDEEFPDLPDEEKPYNKFFGDSPIFYFGLELDWLPLHIPYVASVGIGASWGYARAGGHTVVSDTGAEADSETHLNIFPMYIDGVIRVDGPLRELDIPVVPYLKLGLGAGAWSVSGPDGDTEADGRNGADTSLGLHVAVGGAVALNAFDPSSGMAMREATGIRYVYVYGEWMYANLDGIGSESMHVGTQTAVFGIAADF